MLVFQISGLIMGEDMMALLTELSEALLAFQYRMQYRDGSIAKARIFIFVANCRRHVAILQERSAGKNA